MNQQFHAYCHIIVEMNSVKEINIKNHTCDFFDNLINVKNLDPNDKNR